MWYDGLVGGLMNFLLYASGMGLLLLIIGVASYPIWIKKLFPIPLIILKNAGGAKDGNTVVLDRKVIKYARRINTPYGPRLKIRGVSDTVPVSLISRENAIPWERGGVAFIVYEKEVGQFAAVNPQLQGVEFLLSKEKSLTSEIKRAYERFREEHPEIASHVRLRSPDRVFSPVAFVNQSVNIRPFPADLVTPTFYEMKIRQERVNNVPGWQKWVPYAIMVAIIICVIVISVLSYDQVNKSIDDRIAQLESSQNGLAERIADKMAANEPAPGGRMILPFIPFLWRRKRWASS